MRRERNREEGTDGGGEKKDIKDIERRERERRERGRKEGREDMERHGKGKVMSKQSKAR